MPGADPRHVEIRSFIAVGGYICGLNHEDSARLSFLTATPIILGAVALEARPQADQTSQRFSAPLRRACRVWSPASRYLPVWGLMRWFKNNSVRGF